MDQLAAMAAFVRAVESGSLSAAARALPSSLTSVSRQISALEEHFGTRLLLRTTRQLALTDDGRILYERAKSILGEVREIEAALSRDPLQPSGRIRVSSPGLIGRLVIAPLLVEFLRRYPALSVDLLLVDRAVDMGGIATNYHAEVLTKRNGDDNSVVPGLMAIGEAACVSVHGANRLGSNSLIDLVVFGRAAALRLADKLTANAKQPELPKDSADLALGRLDHFRHGQS